MKSFYEVIHHGGRHTVTGSCHELRLTGCDGQPGLLVDCGLLQERGAEEGPQIDFPVTHLKALVLTHVHIDHCGRIPYLIEAGFDGPIYCSAPSARFLPLVLEDAVRLGITRDRRLVETLLKRIMQRVRSVPYGVWQPLALADDVESAIRLQPAGHILGSAYVEVSLCQKGVSQRVVFSGDLGAPYTPLLPAPKPPARADLLVLESTYGDRNHTGRRERRAGLQTVVEQALADRGAVLIPAFSIGRTQELLYEIEDIIYRNRRRFAAQGLPWAELEVILDSPLASRFTEAFRSLRPFWDAEAHRRFRAGRLPLNFDQLTTIDSHEAHEFAVAHIRKTARPCIVLAASGMCAGGRIVNYLRELLPDPRTDVVFVGYQAAGTPGREIQEYGPRGGYVFLDGERIDIRARIHTLSGYSAHADQKDLLAFVRRMPQPPKAIRLVHGEEGVKMVLKAKLEAVMPDCLVDV
jgi:metallo-beta-lactamase family protein